jgi:proteasome lid subunit RPN8/RPN11
MIGAMIALFEPSLAISAFSAEAALGQSSVIARITVGRKERTDGMRDESDPTENNCVNDFAHSTGPAVLVLPGSLRLALLAHLREWLPFEGCALLGGHFEPGGRAIAVSLYPGANTLHSRTRYRMAATDLIAAHKAMRSTDQDLVAIVHSHPESDPIPSATDLAEAFYPQAAMLIVGFGNDHETMRAWALHPDRATAPSEIPIEP